MDKKVILIADDEDMNRMIVHKFLKKEYEFLEAVDGIETLEVLKKQKVDLIILDIIMPGMNGLEVLEAVKKIPEYNNIGILVATSTKEKTERMALAAGADDIVSKPYDPIVIKRRIENILAKKEIESRYEARQTAPGDEQQDVVHDAEHVSGEGSKGMIQMLADKILALKDNLDDRESMISGIDNLYMNITKLCEKDA